MRQRIGSILVRPPQVAREYITIDGTGTASVVSGSAYVTLTDNGTGDYTLALKQPGARFLHASAITYGTGASNIQLQALPTDGTTIRVLCFDLATPTAADAKFIIAIDVQLGRTNEF